MNIFLSGILESTEREQATELVQEPTLNVPTETEPCIWNSAEIKVLRNFFKETKEENIGLRSRVQIVTEDLAELKNSHRVLEEKHEDCQTKLMEAENANKRLQILAGMLNLKSELDRSRRTVKQLQKDLEESRTMQQEGDKKWRKTQQELEEEKLLRENLEIRWDREIDDIQREHRCIVKESEREHRKELTKLKGQMEILRVELEKEKLQRKRVDNGLKHLQMHFASSPLSGEPNRSVSTDQITKLSYH